MKASRFLAIALGLLAGCATQQAYSTLDIEYAEDGHIKCVKMYSWSTKGEGTLHYTDRCLLDPDERRRTAYKIDGD